MIYPVNDGFVISSGGLWLPGSYATEQAAQYAFQFTNAELERLQRMINQGQQRPITTEDLKEAHRELDERQ